MATIAVFDENDIVSSVIKAPDHVKDPYEFVSSLGIEFSFVEFTSFSGRFGGHYAAIGDSYDDEKGIFVAPQPYASWVFNDSTGYWSAPVAYPEDGLIYVWNENIKNWDEEIVSESENNPSEI